MTDRHQLDLVRIGPDIDNAKHAEQLRALADAVEESERCAKATAYVVVYEGDEYGSSYSGGVVPVLGALEALKARIIREIPEDE